MIPFARTFQLAFHFRQTPTTTHPDCDDRAVQHLLTTSRPFQPFASKIEHDHEDSRVADESRTHDIVRRALSEITTPTKPEGGCDAEDHLYDVMSGLYGDEWRMQKREDLRVHPMTGKALPNIPCTGSIHRLTVFSRMCSLRKMPSVACCDTWL